MTAPRAQQDIVYPESDGQPIGETGIHVEVILALYSALKLHVLEVPDVHVSADQFLFYVEGDPQSVVCLGVYVVQGPPHNEPRRTFKLWEEGRPPSVIFEITSDRAREEEMRKKKDCYETIGVQEIFFYDPLDEYLESPIQGFRLLEGRYHRIAPDADGLLESQVLGVKLQKEGIYLRLTDRTTGRPLRHYDEVYADHRQVIERSRKAE